MNGWTGANGYVSHRPSHFCLGAEITDYNVYTVMIREEILDQLDNSREQMLILLEPLPDEALVETGVMDEWSIADILAHLTAWESEMVTALMRIDQGKKPRRLLDAYDDIDGYNARRFAENEGRDLDRIFADWHDVRLQIEDWLEAFSDKQLNDPKRFRWAKGRPLVDFIKETSWQHEAKHLPEIARFATSWQVEE